MACPDLKDFARNLFKFDETVEIDKDKDKPLRFNVWAVTPDHVKNLFKNDTTDGLPQKNVSRAVMQKIDNSLKRIRESAESAATFRKEILDTRGNILHSIALHEIMESVKGESDKARNKGIEISSITNDGILPALPLSRVAASIGRKIMFQKGYRFKSAKKEEGSAKNIEEMYYTVGKNTLDDLAEKGYVDIHEGLATIKDYIDEADMKKEFPEKELTTDKVMSVSINTKKLGIKADTPESQYFLNRTAANLNDTELGTITEMLRTVRQVTQASTIVLPEIKIGMSLEDLAEKDAPGMTLDTKTAAIRKQIYDTPTFVNGSMHDLMKLLNEEVNDTGESATTILSDTLGKESGAVQSLFGLKRSDDYSVDKKESIAGQNLSKTTPLDDLADYYNLLTDAEGNRSPLHMIMRLGRNGRLYYDNSVLNPHASKQSRYMLTAGEYTVDKASEDFDYLVYGIGQALDKNLSYKELTEGGNTKLERALKIYEKYQAATTLKKKLIQLRQLPKVLPGTDYATALTTLQAITDIRNPVDGKISTEFTVSADATASGGTLTFLQALGTDPEIVNFMERIGLFKPTTIAEPDLDDLYGLMSEAVQTFVKEEKGIDDAQPIMQATLDVLFDAGNDVRELSKDPTMTFVYGQGKTGAINTMSRKLSDRIIDNIHTPEIRDYVARLFNDDKFKTMSPKEILAMEGFYKEIANKLKEKGLPGKLYDLMDIAINETYLERFKKRSKNVFDLAKKIPAHIPVKILPAAAVMSGNTDINKYGIPITKLFEVSHEIEGGNVLTRKEKLMKTVMDVSTIHGIDAAQLYHSLLDTMADSGVVVVHDDVRGNVKTVRAMEKEYAKQTVDIISKYDVHQQVLDSIAHYAPELADTKEYKKLKEQIDSEVATKKKLIKENFNDETDALIGDGNAFRDFAEGKAKAAPETKPTAAPTPTPTPTPKAEPATKATAKPEPEVKTEPTPEPEPEEGPAAKAEPAPEVETAEQYQKSAQDYTESVEDNPRYGDTPQDKATLNYLNYAVASMLNSKLERKGKKVLGNAHTRLKEVFPMYLDASDKLRGIYNSSEALQQLVHTVTGEGIDKVKKADILAKFQQVSTERSDVMNQQMTAFNAALKPFNDEQKKTIGKFVTQMPLHDYFVLANELTTVEEIAAEASRLEKELRSKQPAAVKDVKDLINLNVYGNQTGKLYNLEAKYPMGKSKFGEEVRKLLALKSILAIGGKDFEVFLKSTDLVNLIKDQTVANRLSLMDNNGTSVLRDNLVPDYYKEPTQKKAIELKDLKMYEYGEDTGWKILRKPAKGKLGIVYRPTIDSTDIPGAFTDIKLSSTDIDVSGQKARYDGVVATKDGHKLVLTNEEKVELGLVEDFSQGLVRGTAHNMAIQESEIIRNEVLKEETRYVMDTAKDQNLVNIIESDNIDNPWFVKMSGDISYTDLPAAVKAKYAPVGARASNVKNFNEEVDLVRKDISHWLLGGNAKSLFQNPKMKWATRIVKDLVSGSKIGMVVLNPIKIANDNISNVSYLSVMGVSPTFIAKNYRDIARDYQGYQDLQRQVVQLKVQLTARPDSSKLKTQIKGLQKRIKQNPVGDLADKGFINSLGSDLVSKNADTLSGFQADMHTALQYLLLNKEGKKNYVSHFIMQLQNLGFQGEDFLSYIGGIAGKFDDGKLMEKELDQVYDRLKEIRTEEDIINYVSQYTTSPGSEAVRVGSAITDLTDVLSKETLYRHLVENENMSESDARIKVLDSFPDYKENMPLAVKQLSDLGIIMFPSFWLRIQKVIYRLGRDKPINLASELMLQEALGTDLNTIIDANIVNKSNSFGGIFHTPLETAGAGSVVPMHIF